MTDPQSTIQKTATNLLRLYKEQKKHISFARPLQDFMQYESLALDRLRSMYSKQLSGIKCLNARYFSDHLAFLREQEIASHYFKTWDHAMYFISHRWESKSNPDPTGRQFATFRSYFDRLSPEARNSSGFWYDFSCLPQENAAGKRTPEEEAAFAAGLKTVHLIATLSHTVILLTSGYLDRSWCCAEWIFASSISPLLADQEQIFPFSNAVKFRHLALLILFLSHDATIQKLLVSGEDRHAVAFINSLLLRTMSSTEATWKDDKMFLNLVLHRHFWYHVRMLGIRNQLAIAFLLLDKYDDSFVEMLFQQFLFLTDDPELAWTHDAHIEIDTMLLDNPDPFHELHFHGHRIDVISHTRIK